MSPDLQESRWARPGHRNGTSSYKPPNRLCPACGFSNFASLTTCGQCSAPLWVSRNSSPSKPDLNTPPEITSHNLKLDGGLAMSRYAPRNSKGHYKATDVWTRAAPITLSPSSKQDPAPSSPNTTPDLGLPYEVQHFILEMMRRILEEGSYEFASRVIPGMLDEKAWSCSEMVELSMWRDTLPNKVPPSALISLPGHSLQQSLMDAVRVRNAATHRHLCDNTELRRMAEKSESLMSMYGDTTRRGKFEWLRQELVEWDAGRNADEKRRKLEDALQRINEKPLESMDWTPNSMSLEEITTPENGVEGGYDPEPMEID